MELYFLRHGIAEEVGPAGSGDAGRALTEKGAAKMHEIAIGLRRLGVKPDALISSPLARAQQTAEVVAKELGLELRISDMLAPGCDIQRLRTALWQHDGANGIMVVGHEPDFGALIGELTGGSQVRMKKGGLCRVDLDSVDEGAGRIVWLLAPRMLRKLQ